MLDLTVELVARAASNSLVVFCFCNLLLVIILLAPKPSPDCDERSEFCVTIVTHDSAMDEQPPEDEEMTPEVMELCLCENLDKEVSAIEDEEMTPEVMELCLCENLDKEVSAMDEQPPEDEETTPQVMELCLCENLEKEGGSYNGKGEDDNEDGGESNNDDDDELRRRIEAFIDKVNREWRAEKLRTQSMRATGFL
ncbi:hypothetical protein BT93_K0672 [Corymbia citriodora subsp. variegata]|nr:hypothetical protein BT93_K0672 [Corymbia citriodora subsp. variegata]